jgi:hypothetical protein
LRPGEVELAEEVRQVLEFSRLQNPGRKASFPRWETWITSPEGFVTDVLRTGPDSWKSEANVFPILRADGGGTACPCICHVGQYQYRYGALDLIDEAVLAVHDPQRGIPIILRL